MINKMIMMAAAALSLATGSIHAQGVDENEATEAMNYLQDKLGKPHVDHVYYTGNMPGRTKNIYFTWTTPYGWGVMSYDDFERNVIAPFRKAMVDYAGTTEVVQ